MKMKNLVAILMLLCAALFALPAMAEGNDESAYTPLGDLVLNGWDGNGKFSNAELNKIDGARYLIVTGSDYENIPRTEKLGTLLFEDYFYLNDDDQILSVPNEIEKDTSGNITNQKQSNGFRVYELKNDITTEDILDFIKSIEFKTPEYVRIELLENDPGRMYYNPNNRHYYRYVHVFVEEEGTDYGKGETWDNALSLSKNDDNKRLGRRGYLATITNEEENSFVMGMMYRENEIIKQSSEDKETRAIDSAWLGGTRYYDIENETFDKTKTTNNSWYWAAGPENGQEFYTGETLPLTYTTTSGGVTTTHTYTGYGVYNKDTTGNQVPEGAWANWNNPDFYKEDGSGNSNTNTEPNYYQNNDEYALMLYFNDSAGQNYRWNDLPGAATTAVNGYIIEYGNKSGTGSGADSSEGTGQGGGDTDEAVLTLELKTNGGSYVDGYVPPVQFKAGHGASLPNKDNKEQIKKQGYSFGGWYLDESLDNGPYYAVDSTLWGEDRTFWAKWTNTITLELYENNTQTLEYIYNKEVTLPSNVEREGYDFAGWDNNGTKITSYTGDEAGGQKTFKAQWTPKTGTITLDVNGGFYDGDKSIAYNYENTITLPTEDEITRKGYTFAGWKYRDSDEDTVTVISQSFGPKTLKAQWSPITYKVVYHANNGTDTTTESSHTYDASEEKLTANSFTKTGYTFGGWATEANGSKVYEDAATIKNLADEQDEAYHLYALWTANSYKVKYNKNADDATGEMADSTHAYDAENQKLTTNGFTKTGYTFTGWNTQSNGAGTSYTDGQYISNLTSDVNGQIELYAQWSPITYTVEYDGNGSTGGSMDNSSYKYDEEKALTANGFAKTGYTFTGWKNGDDTYTDEQSVKNLTAENGDTVTLIAQWTANGYTVKYDENADDATGTMDDSEFTYDESGSLRKNTFGRVGYTFEGWKRTADGASVDYVDEMNVTNLATGTTEDAEVTLYAHWAPISYTVKYDTRNVGTKPDDGTCDIDGTDNNKFTLPSLTDDKFTLEGWYADAAYQTKIGNPGETVTIDQDFITAYASDSTFTFYAKWTRTVDVYVTWEDNNNADGMRPAGISVKVKKENTSSDYASQSKNLTDDDQQKFEFSGMQVHDANGDEIQYTYDFDLSNQPNGASYSVSTDAAKTYGDMADGYHVTLTRTVAKYDDNGNLEIELVWDDKDDQDRKRPASVTVQLYKQPSDGAITAKEGYAKTFSSTDSGNALKHTFTNLDANELGQPITYTLDVTSDLGSYSKTIAGNTVTVSYTPETLTAKVKVTAPAGAYDVPEGIKVTWNGTSYTASTDGEAHQIGGTVPKYAAGELVAYELTASDPYPDDGYTRSVATPTLTGDKSVTNGVLLYEIVLTPKTYSYTLDLNGGKLPEGTEETGTFTYGAQDELPIPTRPGNTFAGWQVLVPGANESSNPTGGYTPLEVLPVGEDGKVKLPADLMGDGVKLVAQWTAQEYKLNFVTRTDGTIDSIEYAYDQNPKEITLPVPTAPEGKGWTFVGWYYDEALENPVGPTFDVQTYPTATESTLYARWQKSITDVTALWDDKNNQDGLRKDVAIRLYINKPDPEIENSTIDEDTGMFFWLKATDNAPVTGTFGPLNVHDENGDEIVYIVQPDLSTLRDDKGAMEYDVRTFAKDDEAQTHLPNYFRLERKTYEKLYGVRLVWEDVNNKYDTRPEKMGIELWANGPFETPPKPETKQDLSAANGWSVTWVAQVNPTIKLKPVEALKYDVRLLDAVPGNYVVSEQIIEHADEGYTEKVITLTLRELLLPPTGDESNLLLWGGMLALSAAALGFLGLRRKGKA